MKKTLIEKNPHLHDASKRKEALTRNIESSSAIEGIKVKRDADTGKFASHRKEGTPAEETAKKPR